ncbi:hypothetical protein SmJEL517_g01999 [Synchytrium microbalum]|uniref:Protein kinase domain-containing protein n=1 Tax=Synchytrium microbalum TaxID=1806994 RepID=A0A507C8Y1_9FUNG|nr:uncharacterized protein SmJEL517_g01999 [Synchytrium microbalum]TPX35798.1 hypothetical protein SmJEL517_g01999 [Synchytrium microbalum]
MATIDQSLSKDCEFVDAEPDLELVPDLEDEERFSDEEADVKLAKSKLVKNEVDEEDEEEGIPDFSALLLSREHTMAIRGLKLGEPNGSDEHRTKLQESMDAYMLVLSEERRAAKRTIVEATWLPKERMAEIIQPTGVHFMTTGRLTVKGKLRLFPEETLYLMERSVVVLRVGAGLVSLQQAYLLLLDSWCTLEKCQAYMYLRRLGYCVYRHSLLKESDLIIPQADKALNDLEPTKSTVIVWKPLNQVLSFLLSRFTSWWKPPRKSNVYDALVNTSECISFDDIYKQLRVIPLPILESPLSATWALDFDAYKPRSHFKKSNPGPPSFSFTVIKSTDSIPISSEFEHLQSQVPDIPVKLVVLDGAVEKAYYNGAEVAVKSIDVNGQRQNVLNLRKEAGVLISLRHPNIVYFYGITETTNLHRRRYLVMEYMEGGSLDGRITSMTDWKERFKIAMDVVRGLLHIHFRKILHRDLKSANILLDGTGRAKLADFGLASQSAADLASAGKIGTMAYMAPELNAGTSQATEATDVYSLGVLLCEIGSCIGPYGVPLEKITSGNIKWFWLGNTPKMDRWPCPIPFKELIVRCLSIQPESRPTANQVMEYMQLYQDEMLQYGLVKTGSSASLLAPNPPQSALDNFAQRFGPTSWQCNLKFKAHSFFISYRVSSDSLSAKLLWYELRNNELHGYLDEECLQPSMSFEASFLAGLLRSRIIVLIVSKHAILPFREADKKPDNMLLEWENALEAKNSKQSRVYPVFVASQDKQGKWVEFTDFDISVFPNVKHAHPMSKTQLTIRETVQRMFAIEGTKVFKVDRNMIPGLKIVLQSQIAVDSDRAAELAQLQYQKGEFEKAVYWAKMCIDLTSHATGHYIYGLCLEDGSGGESKNTALASEQFQKASERGSMDARIYLQSRSSLQTTSNPSSAGSSATSSMGVLSSDDANSKTTKAIQKLSGFPKAQSFWTENFGLVEEVEFQKFVNAVRLESDDIMLRRLKTDSVETKAFRAMICQSAVDRVWIHDLLLFLREHKATPASSVADVLAVAIDSPEDASSSPNQGVAVAVTSSAVGPPISPVTPISPVLPVTSGPLETRREIITLTGHAKSVYSLFALPSPDNCVFSGSGDNTIKKWSFMTNQCEMTFSGHTGFLNSVDSVFVFQGVLYSASRDKTAKQWDLKTGKVIRTYKGHTGPVWGLHVIPQRLFTASADKTIREYDTNSGQLVKVYTGHTNEVFTVWVDGTVNRMFSASQDKRIIEWNIQSGKQVKTYLGHTNSVYSVKALSELNRMWSGSWDETIREWNTVTGDCVRVYSGHTGSVSTLCVLGAPNFRLYSGSHDRSIREWDINTGQVVRQYIGHTNYLTSIFCLLPSNLMFSASLGTTMRVWDITP